MENAKNPVLVGDNFITNYLAFQLARAGFSPMIIHPKENIEKDFKISLLDSSFQDFIGKEKMDSITIKKIQKFKIFLGKKELNLKLSKPLCVIDENKLNNIYQKLAEEKGATYYFGNKIKKYVIADKAYGKTNEIKFSTDLIIFDKLNETENKLEIQQAICTFNENRDYITYFFDKDLTEIPYAWIIPLNDNKACIGYFTRKADDEKFNEFLNYFDVNPLKKYVFKVPLEQPSILSRNRIIYLGEAGGFYNPLTGSSMSISLKSSEIIMSAIKKAYEEEEFSSEFLRENYEIPLKENYLLNLRILHKLRADLMNMNNKDYEIIFNEIKKTMQDEKTLEMKNYDFMLQELFHKAFLNKKLKFRFLLKNLKIK